MARQSREEWKIYKNVFDKFTIETILKLMSSNHFDGLTSPVEIGKESNVFLAEKGDEVIIVKIYRLESCNFNKMYTYITSDPRYQRLKKQRRKVIFSWVQREYRNLLLAREVVNVPTPFAIRNNVLVMEMIGDNEPAPQLKDAHPTDPDKFFKKTIEGVRKLYKKGLVHADLSAFNILNHNEQPFFIDFSQSTSNQDPHAKEYLKRDINNLTHFFSKLGVESDQDSIFEEITKSILR